MAGEMNPEMEIPPMEQGNLVSFVQSIADGIAAAPEMEILDMINEILTIKKSTAGDAGM
jgi:hypothetical protein